MKNIVLNTISNKQMTLRATKNDVERKKRSGHFSSKGRSKTEMSDGGFRAPDCLCDLSSIPQVPLGPQLSQQ